MGNAPWPKERQTVIVKLEFGRSKKRPWLLNAVCRTLNGRVPTSRPTCFGKALGALNWQRARDSFLTTSGKLPRTLNGRIPTLRPTCFGKTLDALDWAKSKRLKVGNIWETASLVCTTCVNVSCVHYVFTHQCCLVRGIETIESTMNYIVREANAHVCQSALNSLERAHTATAN